ncbi:MAG: acetylglutamate kinase [Alphaproteobacteria bacterium]
MPKDNSEPTKKAGAAPLEAAILSKALPYMQRYDQATVVVKYGGNAMGDPELATSFARDIVLLKQSGVNPIVVHGGGPQIGALLDKLGIKSEFQGGLRVTDQDTMDVVEMVLAGSINKKIVASINAQGGKAVGISGKDASLMTVRKLEKQIADPDSNLMKAVDLGFVGEPTKVDPHIIEVMIASDLIPVVAPLGVSREGQTYNVNADTFAGELAVKMLAKRLLLLTDVEGVLDKKGKLIPQLTLESARALIEDGTIDGGMIPKIESCISVVQNGVKAVVIINGKTPHAVLLELFTEHGVGTLLSSTGED